MDSIAVTYGSLTAQIKQFTNKTAKILNNHSKHGVRLTSKLRAKWGHNRKHSAAVVVYLSIMLGGRGGGQARSTSECLRLKSPTLCRSQEVQVAPREPPPLGNCPPSLHKTARKTVQIKFNDTLKDAVVASLPPTRLLAVSRVEPHLPKYPPLSAASFMSCYATHLSKYDGSRLEQDSSISVRLAQPQELNPLGRRGHPSNHA